MKCALPTPAYRHPPSRGTSKGVNADPLGLLKAATDVVAATLPPGAAKTWLSSGLGLDVLDLVELGIDLVRDPLAFGADLFQDLMGEALGMIRGFVGRVIDVLEDFGALLAMGWDLLKEIPILGRYVAFAEAVFKNFLDMLWYRLTGQLASLDDPGVGDKRCPGQLPKVEGELDYQAFVKEGDGAEIAVRIAWLFDRLLPTIYQFSDDAPPLSIEAFEGKADKIDGTPVKWDVREPFRDDIEAQWCLAGPPYLKAWKLNNRRILVEIGMLRAVSFWGCPRKDSPLTYEHEGDGERLYVHLQVDPSDTSSAEAALASPTATVRLTGIIGTGHKEQHPYSWEKLNIEGERATAAVARGSHATSIAAGPTETGNQSWEHVFQIDFYPTPAASGVISLGPPQIETRPCHLRQLYEQSPPKTLADDRAKWGAHCLVGSNYAVWIRGCDFSGEYVKTCFPLEPSQEHRCKLSAPCKTCPPVVDVGDVAKDPSDTACLSTNRIGQGWNDMRYLG